jgi:hypothetical protein
MKIFRVKRITQGKYFLANNRNTEGTLAHSTFTRHCTVQQRNSDAFKTETHLLPLPFLTRLRYSIEHFVSDEGDFFSKKQVGDENKEFKFLKKIR